MRGYAVLGGGRHKIRRNEDGKTTEVLNAYRVNRDGIIAYTTCRA